jgi:ubiquinone/menaquinone biosynthesis C-methylase UbiE
MRISRKEAADGHSSLVARNAVYLRYGWDVERSISFVLSKALPLTGHVLEIGTGKGRFLAALLRHAPRVTTIDLNPAEQRVARANVAYERPPGRVTFRIVDAENLPWKAGSFDAVVSMNALHHIRNPSHVVDEAIRVARPSGKIVLADFNKKGFSIMEKLHLDEQRIHACVPYRIRDLVERFAARGWAAVVSSGDCQDLLVAVKKCAANASGDGSRVEHEKQSARVKLRPRLVTSGRRQRKARAPESRPG